LLFHRAFAGTLSTLPRLAQQAKSEQDHADGSWKGHPDQSCPGIQQFKDMLEIEPVSEDGAHPDDQQCPCHDAGKYPRSRAVGPLDGQHPDNECQESGHGLGRHVSAVCGLRTQGGLQKIDTEFVAGHQLDSPCACQQQNQPDKNAVRDRNRSMPGLYVHQQRQAAQHEAERRAGHYRFPVGVYSRQQGKVKNPAEQAKAAQQEGEQARKQENVIEMGAPRASHNEPFYMLHSTLQAFNLARQRCLDRVPAGR
jgi:hypothetical protein